MRCKTVKKASGARRGRIIASRAASKPGRRAVERVKDLVGRTRQDGGEREGAVAGGTGAQTQRPASLQLKV